MKIDQPDARYLLTAETAASLMEAMDEEREVVEVSLNLGISRHTVSVNGARAVFDDQNYLDRAELDRIQGIENRVYCLQNNDLRALECRDEGYYKLVPTAFAPTVEINGVKMHRSKNYDPFIDAKEKAREVVRPGSVVLDTCGGLGYTAIWSVRLGARQVMSVERDPYIRKLRKENPWSAELYQEKIERVFADVADHVTELKSGSFDVVIHDPPRISLSGHLYGKVFYAELLRLLTRKGRMFHYTGRPHSARLGNKFYENTVKRLKQVGFKQVRIRPQYYGVIATK